MKNIQFSHANGFPAQSYNCMLKYLKADKINYIPAFGLNRYTVKRNWQPLVDELIENIEQNFSEPVIGVGHSLGAVLSLLAAHQRSDLFKRLILMDPPIFTPLKRWVVAGLVAANMLEKMPHPANKSKTRRTHFESREEAFEYFKAKALFMNTQEECLQNYVEYGLKPSDNGGYELFIPRPIEYKIFITMPLFIPGKKLPFPVDMLYSTKFEAMSAHDFKWVQKKFSYIRFTPMNASHIFPFEMPEETAVIINKIISEDD